MNREELTQYLEVITQGLGGAQIDVHEEGATPVDIFDVVARFDPIVQDAIRAIGDQWADIRRYRAIVRVGEVRQALRLNMRRKNDKFPELHI